jgi:hypothetical protein
MKRCSLQQNKHNLNIQMYSFNELLELFDLTDANHITPDQLKEAKKMVLKTHPDKSRLPPEYFIFYKKAFEIIVDFFNNQNKVNKTVPTTEIPYNTTINSQHNKSTEIQIQTTINSMKPEKFQKTFNELFEQNNMGRQIVNKNEWFSNENDIPVFDTTTYSNNNNNNNSINSNIERMKEKHNQQGGGMVMYKGVQELQFQSSLNSGYLYEDINGDNDDDDETYIETDPFSKLKFEDLKKVHKNETVFSISEKDFNKIPQYKNIEQYVKTRDETTVEPLTKQLATEILEKKENELRSRMLKKEYELKKKQTEYENKNKSILSYFLQLT